MVRAKQDQLTQEVRASLADSYPEAGLVACRPRLWQVQIVALGLLVAACSSPQSTTGGAPGTISVGDGPSATTFADGALWVANHGSSTVTRIDTATDTVTATIKVDRGPRAITSGDGSVWTANIDANSVSRIDVSTNSVTATIPVGLMPSSITFGRGSLWVANSFEDTVSRIDPARNQVI